MGLGPNLILVGDLNSKALSIGCKSENQNGQILEEILTNSDLIVVNDKFSPTYFSRSNSDYSEILDLILCSSSMYQLASNFEVLEDYTMGSDHAPIACNINLKKCINPNLSSKEPRYNFSKADWSKYKEILNGGVSELESPSVSLDVNSLNDKLCELMRQAADASIPKYIECSVKSYPKDIVNLIKLRREFKKDFRKTKDLEAKILLKSEYNRLTCLLRKSISEHTEKTWLRFLGKLGPYPVSTREFWAKINQAKKQKKSGEIPNLVFENVIYKSDEEKANLFASILSETFTDNCTSSDFDCQIHSYVEDFVEKLDYSDNEFSKVSLAELSVVIKKLKVGSSPGEDNIHNLFLKNLPTGALEKLLELVNLSLAEGLPDAWKTASITMIPKKENNSNSPSDYRPISLTSCVGKLTERVVKGRLYKFLEGKNLIVKEQSGFRNKRGTADNLISMTQKIKECLNRKKKALGIYFDISKAFDKVWHAGLLYKLVYLGVPLYLIRFIKSFLKKRFFKVVIKKIKSKSNPIDCSVPQGSVLGPLLFLVYIGDIPLSNAANISFSALFADDLCALFIFKKKSVKLENRIRAYLQSLVDWLFKWRLKMNASKCCFTIFSNGGREGIDFDLFLNNELIPYNPNPVFLGITFDERLCFNTHFANLRVRALRRLNIIKIFSHKSWHLNSKTLTTIFRALVGSIFDYSFFSVINCSKTSLDSIERVQNRAIRCIFHLPWESPSDQLFTISGVLPLKQRFTQLGSRYLAKALYFKNKFILSMVSDYIRSYSTITSKKKLKTPFCWFLTMIAVSINLLKLFKYIFYYFFNYFFRSSMYLFFI